MEEQKEHSQLPAAYDPKTTDTKWIHYWESHNTFQANASSTKPPFTIVMPPPNVTGVLHMGHALVTTLQDILTRYHRMCGYEALWVPGTDHAGIATQTVVERHLLQCEGKRRTDFSREEFLKIVWAWKERHQSRIVDQIKRLGASCDFSRYRFTMDDQCSRAVKTLFKKMFDDGLIYRGDYLVNWDPVTKTALADDEVEYEERDSFLWFFRFPLADGSATITVATTRPETMLGDTAVAVSPKDERYVAFIGKEILHPLTKRKIPIVADSFVDPEFGTGAVKITPAHDPNDYRLALTHRLPMINILTPDGKINETGGPYANLSTEEARKAIVEFMKSGGYLEKIVPHKLRVGLSYRSKAVIEPYLSKQWFIKMAPFIEPLKNAVKEGKVKIIPKQWEATYFHWVENLRDWCISRQLWWGHRIPVWINKEDPTKMICSIEDKIPDEVAREPHLWEQDPDVLDTWFSSALWPVSTLGWPEKSADFKKFYPTSVLVTGHDILFFWVARMILIGEYTTGKVPFDDTFLHGLIYGRSYYKKNQEGGITYIMGKEKESFDLGGALPPDVDSKWEKLSKSKGNVIDPIDMIDTYGADAVRLALSASANQSPQIDLDRRRFEEYKHFANKIWNGARFVFMNLEDLTREELAQGINPSLFSLEDEWILTKLNHTLETVNIALKNYNFETASSTAYDFFWKEFCAYYLEIAKPLLSGKRSQPKERINKQKILLFVLNRSLRMLHPLIPFITEEIFELMKERFHIPSIPSTADPLTKDLLTSLLCPCLALASFPTPLPTTRSAKTIEAQFDLFQEMVYTVRNIRGEMKIPPNIATDLYLIGDESRLKPAETILRALLKINQLNILASTPHLQGLVAKGAVGDIALLIPLPDELAKKERHRLEKERERLLLSKERVKNQLANEAFLEKASPEIIGKQKELLLQVEKELNTIEEKLK